MVIKLSRAGHDDENIEARIASLNYLGTYLNNKLEQLSNFITVSYTGEVNKVVSTCYVWHFTDLEPSLIVQFEDDKVLIFTLQEVVVTKF